MIDALVHQFALHDEIASYDTALTRTVKRHRAEIRAFFGFRETSMEDGEALSAWLRDHAVAEMPSRMASNRFDSGLLLKRRGSCADMVKRHA